MTNKEEKFWGAVRASEKDWQAASDLLTVLWTKNMSPETPLFIIWQPFKRR